MNALFIRPPTRADLHRVPTHLLQAFAVATLCGCALVKVDMPAQRVTPPDRFAEAPAEPGSSLPDTARWWRQVPDPTLHTLIEQGLQANADVRIALARVKEARGVSSQAESALYPTLSGFGGIGRNRQDFLPSTPDGLPVPLPDVRVPISRFDGFGLAAAWEVDLFGRRRSDIDAAREAELAQTERVHGAQLLVAGDIAANYVEARAIEHRLGVLDRVETTLQTLLRYVRGRFTAGQASRADIDRAQAQLASVQGQRAPLQGLLASRLRRLAVLSGQTPDALSTLPAPTAAAPANASVIPTALPIVLPSSVLEQRPDVRGTARQVRTLAARLGSAKAELLPSFYLGFLNTDGRLSIGDNLGARDQFTAWGVGMRLPIFEGGRIRARIASADARLEAAAVQHEQAVLSALEDVENAYGMRHALDQRATQLAASLQHGNDAARHAQRLFEQGSTLFQPALEARLTALQREDELIQTQAARARATIAFYQAIGGGWQDETASRAETAERAPR
ncbi:TolC family protein [uncultured Aquabacterium sp.]|jgi:NodT family efflux transporter outer membrane factor (OMF) lipoprotein|uniref:efflux transporter outer membrane subunit n=1 Tax=uncultured Aquabacterium sp. TaxID=158753 RepID=UPI00261D16E1|nr:TolC family protein [uncultured Aquabacterium sp.]